MPTAIEIALGALVQAFKPKDWTAADVRLYTRKLQSVPVPVLTPMVDRAISTRHWMPKVAELLADAETARLELLKRLGPYTGCVECEGQIGWRNRLDVPRTAERCPCHARWQQKVQALGVGHARLALPAAPSDWAEVGDGG